VVATATENDSRSDTRAKPEPLKKRELRADRVATRHGLTLVKSRLRCGGSESRRYDLLDERYNQLVATNLKLSAVETWLGIRGTMLH